MAEPIRVLHVLGGVSLGGAESRIMDLYRCMDREKIQFDFLVHSNSVQDREPEFYDEEIKSMGGRIYVLPKFKVYNYIVYQRAVRQFFGKHHDYKVVQGHMTSTASIYLPIAKSAGIPVAAAHARSAGVDKGIKGMVTKWLRLSLLGAADYCFACSKEAGQAVFGKEWEESDKAWILPNTIEAEKYIYHKATRDKLAVELGVENCYVIGHVGRFHYAKNHDFLLDVFAILQRKLKAQQLKAVLLLLGEGGGMQAAKEKVRKLGLEKQVLFMGNRKDVENYYQVMDYFVFPSHFEGLPGTVVEAQAAGLRCIISDHITSEVGFSELVHYESIEGTADLWADFILEHAFYERRDMSSTVKKAGFDVSGQAQIMGDFYQTGKMHA